MRTIVLAAATSLLLSTAAFAEEKTEVKPGTAPTDSVTEAVPDMKTGCPGQTAAKPPGTEATTAMTEVVPDMKADPTETGSIGKAPGTEATEKMGELVPDMKPDDTAQAGTGTPGTEATEGVGKAVPDMKPSASNC